MVIKPSLFLPLLVCLLLTFLSASPQTVEHLNRAASIEPSIGLIKSIQKKTQSLQTALQKQSQRYLSRISRREQRLYKKLYKKDSIMANQLFNNAPSLYTAMITDLKKQPLSEADKSTTEYLPYLDSIKGAVAFLESHSQIPSYKKEMKAPLKDINQLQNRLKQTSEIDQFLKDRRTTIKEALKQYSSLPGNISKDFTKLNKLVYYHGDQLRQYKELLKSPGQIENKILSELRKLPAFTSFMEKHSFLSGMFPVPADYGQPTAMEGLQTREQVQQLLAGRIASGGPNTQASLQQQMQAAQAPLQQLKNKLNEAGGTSGLDMPDFKPNHQKTKSFKDRLELGGNLQTVKSNRFFPGTTDLGASAGYKLNDKSVIGVGASYKFGWGRDIRNIHFSSEGLGLRSFIDYQLKGSFWLSGGAELNYRSSFSNFEILKNYSSWQQSALIGISKKYKVSKKLKGNAQLLYDALWKQQVPRTQALVFRIGSIIN